MFQIFACLRGDGTPCYRMPFLVSFINVGQLVVEKKRRTGKFLTRVEWSFGIKAGTTG